MTRQERADVAKLRDVLSRRDGLWVLVTLAQIIEDDRKARPTLRDEGA